MSHQPSPAPSGSSHAAPTAPSQRAKASQKQPMPAGVAANVEEIKYKAKYKDLKKKVKEIELENDQLFYKVLNSKRNVQRLRLERAVLYERLAQLPPSPRAREEVLPPPPAPTLTPQYTPNHVPQMPREPTNQLSSRDLEFQEYLRQNPHATVSVIPGPDGRPIPVIDATPPPRAAPVVRQSSRHGPPLGEERGAPPAPVGYNNEPRHLAHGHPVGHIPYAQQPMHASGPLPQLNGRARPPSTTSHDARIASPPYGHHVPMPAQQHYAQASMDPPSPSRSGRSGSPGAGGYANTHRIHAHQRVGPGANLNADEWERQRDDRMREREMERSHELERNHRREYDSREYARRQSVDESVRHVSSGTPGSVRGGSVGRDAEPGYRASPRSVHLGADDMESSATAIAAGGRQTYPDPLPAVTGTAGIHAQESRKRRRDMDVDVDRPAASGSAQSTQSVHHAPMRGYPAAEDRVHQPKEQSESRSVSREAQDEEAMDAD